MDNIQLFALQQGQSGYSGFLELDLYQEEPIKITKQVESLEDPTKTASNFSRTFRVPHTPTNGKYFKAVFNVNAQDYDARQKADAYVTVNGSTFMEGNLRINQIIRGDATGKIEYELIFMGETSNFASVVAPKELSELNLDDFNHTINYTQITKSWERKLFDGDIVYPLAEWGYTYTSGVPNQSTLSKYDGVVSKYGFTSSSFPLDTTQFKPAIRAKVVWDKIFEEAGFTYESEFLDQGWFTDLYLISSNEALPTQRSDSNFEAQNGFQDFGTVTPGDAKKLKFPSVVYNNGNAWLPTLSEFIAPFTGGPYLFTIKDMIFEFQIPQPPAYQTAPPYTFNMQFQLFVNGVKRATQTGYIDYTQQYLDLPSPVGKPASAVVKFGISGNFETTLSANITKGDSVELYVIVPSGQTNSAFDLRSGIFSGITPNVVNPAGLMPANTKQIDFIKGINDRFKLIWEPDPENPKNFYIEPWKDWVGQGEQKDWTDKLNNAKDVSITPTFYTQQRQITFKDSKESDIYNFSYEQEYKEVFGERKQDSGIEVITGNRDLTSIFSPVPLAPIGNNANFLIPHFAKDTENERQPIQVKPRLMFYNGMQTSPLTWYISNDTVNPSVSTAKTEYPVFSQYDRYPFNESAFDLNWKNVEQFWDVEDTPNVGSGRTPRDAYNLYWEDWYNDTFSSSSRILEGTFVLDYQDVTKLRFNDLLFVKDAWYMPLEIKDYVLGATSEVKVKLLKLGTVGINIDTTGPGSGVKSYPYSGLCFGDTLCDAYCCNGFAQYTLYSAQDTFGGTFQLFQDQSLFVPAAAGYYSDGTTILEVDRSGFVIAIGVGTSCSCNPLTVSSTACASTNFCTAVCCTSYPVSIYYDGTSLATSTLAFSSAGYGLLTPGTWYKENGSSSPVLIGRDGKTIVQVGNASGCICDELGYDDVLGYGSTEAGGCCGQGTTGAVGTNTMYYDTPNFYDATAFYNDPYQESPIGATADGYVSDGAVYVEVAGATAGATGGCTNAQTIWAECGDRTDSVDVTLENNSGTNTELQVYNEISYDGESFLANGYEVSTGANFDNSFAPLYSPSSWFRMQVVVPAIYGGAVAYVVRKNGDIVHIDSGTSAPYYTLTFGPIGEDVYTVEFEWFP